MNLCDSGLAPCFTGRALAEAARVIRTERPDIVTLNEICSNDATLLARTLRRVVGSGLFVSRFRAVDESGTGHRAVRCRNGEAFGDGLLVHTPADHGYSVSGGEYAAQDPADTEKRGWLCVNAIRGLLACTTHLSSTDPEVALRECRFLMSRSIPMLTGADRAEPVIVGADLNLRSGQPADPQSCVPHGFVRAGDGARQDVLATGAQVVSARAISMHGATDHRALVVDLMLIAVP